MSTDDTSGIRPLLQDPRMGNIICTTTPDFVSYPQRWERFFRSWAPQAISEQAGPLGMIECENLSILIIRTTFRQKKKALFVERFIAST